jgi:hypothetical protein
MDEENLAKLRRVLTALLMLSPCRVDECLEYISSILNAQDDEILHIIERELEPEKLVSMSENRIFIAEEGLKKIEEMGIDEKVVETLMRRRALTISPINFSPSLPRLIQLDFRPPNIEGVTSLIKRIGFKPLQLPHYRPRLIELNMLKPDVSKAFFMSKISLITLDKPRVKLIKIDVEKPKAMLIPITVNKPLFIQLKPPKLIAIDKNVSVKVLQLLREFKPIVIDVGKPKLINLDAQRIYVKTSTISPPEGELIKVEDVADVLELFDFGEEFKDVARLGLGIVTYDRPVIIVAIKSKDQDYVNALRYILRTLHRIATGTLPHGEYITNEMIKIYTESSRQGIVKVIELGKGSGVNINDVLNKLRNRLRELLVEGLSFTVLYVDEDVEEKVKELLEHRDEFGADVIVLKFRNLSREQMYKVSALLWGFKRDAIDLEKGGKEIVAGLYQFKTFDKAFAFFADEYISKLKEVHNEATKKGYTYIVKPHRVEGFAESPEHYLLKVFTVYYFVEKEKVKLEDIRVEEPLPEYGGIIPDVFIASKGIAVEVETLYGEGLAWLNKLVQSVEKYKHCSVSEVWLVIPPLQASIFMKPLMSFAKWLNERRPISARVRILTVDLKEKEFVPVAKIGRLVRRVLRGESILEEPAKN